MENIVIGIEGDVASGKTTICKELINIIPNSIFIKWSLWINEKITSRI